MAKFYTTINHVKEGAATNFRNHGLESLLTLVVHIIIDMTDDIKRKEKHEVKTDDFGNVTEEKHEVEEEED